MAREKTKHQYELWLRRLIKERTGKECEEWLYPQIEDVAGNKVVLAKIREALMNSEMLARTTGSMSQLKNEVNPLLPIFDKLQRTLIAQYEALGLNYNTTPSKVTENTKQGGSGSDKLANIFGELRNIK